MPAPEVFEAEYIHWPWGKVLAAAVNWVEATVPKSGFVVDYMCGTGFLLSEIAKRRRDITALGCDIHAPYVKYGQDRYASIELVEDDALVFHPPAPPDLIICTAGIHHLARDDQPRFISKVSRELAEDGLFLVGEEVISSYADEEGRRGAILEMFRTLMAHIGRTRPRHEVVQAAADVMVNDWCERGEYKTSKSGLEELLTVNFNILSARHIWPEDCAGFGDWLLACRKRPISMQTAM
jgi:SAM-dependent methyltransferase